MTDSNLSNVRLAAIYIEQCPSLDGLESICIKAFAEWLDERQQHETSAPQRLELPHQGLRATKLHLLSLLAQIAVLAEYGTTGPDSGCKSEALTAVQATSLRNSISELARKGLSIETLVAWTSPLTWRCRCKAPGNINSCAANVCTDCETLRPERETTESRSVQSQSRAAR